MVVLGQTLGLTTSVPKVVRVKPTYWSSTRNTNAKWYMVVGSGPTGYDGRTTQYAKVIAVDMANGTLVKSFPVG